MDDICRRVRIISDEEMAVFFTKRPDNEVEHVTNDEWKTGKRPDYSVVHDHGVFFCLDEVHIAFNSRAWAATGAEVLYYLSQHRKLGDDVICITQSVANVDKQFRSVAQDFTYIRNLGKEKHGLVRLPLRFVRKTYAQPPTGSAAVEPMDMAIFSLDVAGLARCYDTAKGVGIHGRSGADKRERKKGLHIAWFMIGVPLAAWLVFKYLPRGIVSLTKPNLKHSQAVTNVSPQVQLALPRQTAPAPTPVSPNQTIATAGIEIMRTNEVTDGRYCVGWSQNGNVYEAFMSDGEVYSSADHELDFIRKREISILGKVYPIKAVPMPYVSQEQGRQPVNENYGIITAPRPVNQIQIIPFGNRNQPTQLPEQIDAGPAVVESRNSGH